jgi:hypothetical protein
MKVSLNLIPKRQLLQVGSARRQSRASCYPTLRESFRRTGSHLPLRLQQGKPDHGAGSLPYWLLLTPNFQVELFEISIQILPTKERKSKKA